MECFCICKRKAIVFSGVCCKKLKSIFSVSDGEFREYRASFTQSAKPSFLVPRTPSTFGGLFFEGKNIVCRRHSSVRGMSKKKKIYGGPSTVKALRRQQTHTYGIRVALSMWNFPYFYLFGMKIVDGERTMSIYRNTVRPHARTQKYCTYNRTHRHRMWYAVHTYVRMCDDGVVVVC